MFRRLKLVRWLKWHVIAPVWHFFGWVAPTDWIDCSMYMTGKILPYMKQFQKKQRWGSPVDLDKEEWDLIVDEMVWALDQVLMDNDDDCMMPNPAYDPAQREALFIKHEDGGVSPNPAFGNKTLDLVKYKEKHARIQKGLENMGKYWQNLWD